MYLSRFFGWGFVGRSISLDDAHRWSIRVNSCQVRSFSVNVSRCRSMSVEIVRYRSMLVNIVQYRSMSFNVARCRSMSLDIVQCRPMWFNVGQCEQIRARCVTSGNTGGIWRSMSFDACHPATLVPALFRIVEPGGSEPFGGSLFGGLWTSFDVSGGLSTSRTALDVLDGPDGLERLLESPLAGGGH